MISVLLLNHFYPMISYRRVQKKKKATNYCIRFGRSLWSANQLPAQVVNEHNDTDTDTDGRMSSVMAHQV